jgi:hypothetical protein
VKAEDTPDKQRSEISVLVRSALFVPSVQTIFALFIIFLGAGWGMVFFLLVHLVVFLIPSNAKIGKFMLGKNNYLQLQDRLIRAKKSLFYKVYFSFSSLVIFVVTIVLLRFANVSLIGLITK